MADHKSLIVSVGLWARSQTPHTFKPVYLKVSLSFSTVHVPPPPITPSVSAFHSRSPHLDSLCVQQRPSRRCGVWWCRLAGPS